MRVLTTLTLLLLALGLQAAEPDKIYRWTDAQGVVHFSDKPHDQAEEVVVTPAQSVRTVKADPSVLQAAPAPAEKVTFKLRIMLPAEKETLRDNEGNVSVVVAVVPEMQRGQKLQLLMDGKAVGPATASEHFKLHNVDRGEHQLSARLLGAKKQVLATSEPRTFYLHRARIPPPKSGN